MEHTLWKLIASDLRAKARWNYERDDWRAAAKVLLTDGTLAMLLYRMMQRCHRRHLVLLELCFNKLISVFGDCIIGRGADFGPGFVLIHSTGVVINGRVRGGRNVFLEHQVTIGADRRRSPVLGDDVFVGAGAKILGGITLGSRTRIGANAVVVKDVPSDATAVGIPARIVRRRTADDRFDASAGHPFPPTLVERAEGVCQ